MIDTFVSNTSSHLVQSTLFAGAAALLTLALRANRAEVRFWLWLSASLKFLIPFGLLSMAGSHVATWAPASSVGGTRATAPTFLGAGSSHFSGDTMGGAGSSVGAPGFDGTTLYAALAVVWLAGVVCVALIRLRGWRRIRLLIRASVSTDIAAPVEVRVSPGLLEPGVAGWRRPLLLLPEGFAELLASSEMKALLAHELCHVRRRDNLLVSIHMIVEAIFWFHPAVWWIGARLIEEREYACDEDVVSRGNAPDLYAEAIVKVCKWSTESPLAGLAGVTGGNLQRRIEQIMNARDVPKLSFARKAALMIAGAGVLMAPVLIGITNAPAMLAQYASADSRWEAAAGGHMAFDVASVKALKPGSRGRAPNFPLDGDGFTTDSGENPHGHLWVAFPWPRYISFAYKLTLTPELRQAMLARLPKWVDTDLFEIDAKAAGNPTKDQMRLMMQSLLKERFHLAVHYETQDIPIYALTLVKPGTWGPKLIRHADGPPCGVSGPLNPATGMSDSGAEVFPAECETQSSVLGKYGRIVQGSRNQTMALLAESLGRRAGRPVVDRTGITDRIDYRLEWTLESSFERSGGSQTIPGISGVEVETDPNPVTFVDAVRDQLGLKLESTKGPLRILVIDHIERPSEN